MEQTKSQSQLEKEKEVTQNCDAIVFGSYQQEANVHTVMTFMKTKNKIEPGELGHKFNILLFNKLCPTEKDVEVFTAILGDPRGYVERMGKAGYHGIIAKHSACKRKEIKDIFARVLDGYGFEAKLIKKVIKATVV